MGPTGTGKSTFINLVSGSRLGVGTNLQSETATMQVSQPFKLGSDRVVLVDTPGFDDTLRPDREILTMIAKYMAELHWRGVKIKGVIYLHRITDNRMGGTALRNFRMFEALCGKDAMRNAVIVLNMWNELGNEMREAREKELRESDIFFKHAVDAGADVMRHDGTLSSASTILVHLLKQKPASLQIQRETVNETKEISQTAAGIILLGELATREGKQVEQLQRLRRELEEAREELQDEKGRLRDAGALVRRDPESDGAQSLGQRWWGRALRVVTRRQTA
ncbi:P-loop containing nucleoside triphosphate hydrolase protein [Fomitopsis serialis]|uniref:P-loop containing nucleoside triphosphate hydrolase protein n=1 Tax=Fomitopsis serialis TaxID=139415 RepID=UPI002008021A|nr:P-loop containing nucleoside triphosphate hydrolase protein [Neoantrodia serialis]KAH9925222.1 P-loop containing nucleoside triphosphate hydrolase protein [Neoantrodia serialis]